MFWGNNLTEILHYFSLVKTVDQKLKKTKYGHSKPDNDTNTSFCLLIYLKVVYIFCFLVGQAVPSTLSLRIR